jgi:DNA-binding CsgD family transcriptional regulator
LFRRNGYDSFMASELFVGRRAELPRLRNLLSEVCAGVGGLVLVEGEQGIGKSSLLRAAFANAESSGCRLLWGSADEMGQRIPLQLIANCLGDEGRQTVLGPANGGVPGEPQQAAAGESSVDGLAVFAEDPVLASVERLMTLLDRWCGASPVVLVMEDLQWADEASLLAWSGLSRAVRQLPLLLAGACRPGPGRNNLTKLSGALVSRGGSLLELSPLPDAEVGRLVGRLVGGRPGPRLAGLVRRAGGNPLYVRELADGLVRDGRVEVKAGVAELAGSATVVRVPVSLGAAIAARLGSLSEDVVEVLEWAALLGQEFSVTDLAVVTGRTAGALMEVVSAAVSAGVLADAGSQLGFRHGLIRQELSERLPASLRAALRIEAAHALERAGAAPERVADQLVAVPDLAAHAWALDWLTEHAGTARLLLNRTALANLYYVAGQWDDAIAELEQVIGLPGPRYHDLLVHGLFALIAIRRDQVELAEQHLAAVADEPLHDAAHWTNAATLLQATALAAERDGRPADGLALLARSLYEDGSEAVHVRHQWLPLLTRLALAAGDRTAAADAADAAALHARSHPLPIKIAIADHCRGMVTGDPVPVLTTADYYQRGGRTSFSGQAFEDAAVLAAARGDDATARQALSEALGVYGATAARWDARRASSRLEPYGIQPPHGSVYPGRPATGWYALTPTEMRVAYSLAAGRSNPDIAAELSLSRNTVQTHVSHILAKLGARSRLEIAHEAVKHRPARGAA